MSIIARRFVKLLFQCRGHLFPLASAHCASFCQQNVMWPMQSFRKMDFNLPHSCQQVICNMAMHAAAFEGFQVCSYQDFLIVNPCCLMCITVLDSLELKQFVDLRLLSRRISKQFMLLINSLSSWPTFIATWQASVKTWTFHYYWIIWQLQAKPSSTKVCNDVMNRGLLADSKYQTHDTIVCVHSSSSRSSRVIVAGVWLKSCVSTSKKHKESHCQSVSFSVQFVIHVNCIYYVQISDR